MVGKIIYNILSNDSDVTDIVGTNIYPIIVGQEKNLPFIAYDILSDVPYQSKTGASLLDVYRVQVSAFGFQYGILVDLAEKIRSALDQQSGTVGTTVVSDIVFDGRNNLFDINGHINGIALDFMVWEKRN